MLRLISGGAALLGLLIGLASTPRREPSTMDTDAVEWRLPAGVALMRHDAANLEPVGQLPWKGSSSAQADASKAPDWRLRGIVNDPVLTALVDDGQGKILRFRTGDVLPNGAALVRIESNRIEFESNGCVTELVLHKQPVPAAGQANDCSSDNHSVSGNDP